MGRRNYKFGKLNERQGAFSLLVVLISMGLLVILAYLVFSIFNNFSRQLAALESEVLTMRLVSNVFYATLEEELCRTSNIVTERMTVGTGLAGRDKKFAEFYFTMNGHRYDAFAKLPSNVTINNFLLRSSNEVKTPMGANLRVPAKLWVNYSINGKRASHQFTFVLRLDAARNAISCYRLFSMREACEESGKTYAPGKVPNCI